MEKLRIGIVFGGRSGEHDVSLNSAASVMNELDRDKYEIVPIGITRSGQWLVGGDALKELQEAAKAATTGRTMEETGGAGLVAERGYAMFPSVRGGKRLPKLDVVFPVLHGPNGEDGTIQGLFELANIPYVGCGVLASALGMDKAIQKDVFRQHGLPVLPSVVVKRCEWEHEPEAVVERAESAIGYPCFVKPVNLGSSVGISKVQNRSELVAALKLAAEYDRRILIERGVVPAREIECSVLGNDEPMTSLCGEIVPKRAFYDYVAKYLDESTQLIVPAQIPATVSDRIRQMARQAFLALDCAGMARVDFLANPDLSQIWISEINSIPGFTRVSMYARMFQATGISYRELLDRLIALALERHADKNRTKTTWT